VQPLCEKRIAPPGKMLIPIPLLVRWLRLNARNPCTLLLHQELNRAASGFGERSELGLMEGGANVSMPDRIGWRGTIGARFAGFTVQPFKH
jgi:hypothetical protein